MTEPVTLAEAKTHLRIDVTDSAYTIDDSYITTLIGVAREWCENYLDRSLIDKTLIQSYDDFTFGNMPVWGKDFKPIADYMLPALALPGSPIRSVTSLKYTDINGIEQTLAATEYSLFVRNERGYLILGYGKSWPQIRPEPDAVRITYVAGYATVADVPVAIKQAILLMVGDLYENRSRQTERPLSVNSTVEALLYPLKMWGGV